MSDLDLQLRNQLELIDALVAEKSRWLAQVTDENGDPDVDDEEWYDGIAEFNNYLADLGLGLAKIVRQSLA